MEHNITLPATHNLVRKFHAGDILYISGTIFTARDAGHHLLIELHNREKEIPFNIRQMPLYHCGPLVRKKESGWQIIAAGPTTSMRMEPFESQFVSLFGTTIIIGKGGMGDKTLAALQEAAAVYAHYTGGAGTLAARAVARVVDVHWLDELGIPEAVWILDVEHFGPLIITMDSHGQSLYHKLDRTVNKNMEWIHARINKGA
ncbi:fumarate hydratase C-terminal domain-containing protein [Candidatus Bipolaricaulota bacterium]|nr:fumarate hydratase C-terminal domain-containing protein [Candidatus Bipolaricaulota bacterium]